MSVDSETRPSAAEVKAWAHRHLRPHVSMAAYRVRRQMARVDNPEIRKARRLARMARNGTLDLLYLGDSASSFLAGYDDDRRPLHRMLADGVAPGHSLHALHGGSYNPSLYRGLLRVIPPDRAPAVIVMPLCIRVRTTPWVEHPAHGHKKATEFLMGVDAFTPPNRIRRGIPLATADEWDTFRALPHPTWAGDWTIGDYTKRLKGTEQDDDWVKLLYAYHHGGRVTAGQALDDVRGLGADLANLGSQLVVYRTPVPVEKGSELYGPAFRRLAEDNFMALEAALAEGLGRDPQVLPTGLDHPTDEFIDWRDASEHVNAKGRIRLATAIVNAVRERGPGRPGGFGR